MDSHITNYLKSKVNELIQNLDTVYQFLPRKVLSGIDGLITEYTFTVKFSEEDYIIFFIDFNDSSWFKCIQLQDDIFYAKIVSASNADYETSLLNRLNVLFEVMKTKSGY